MRTEIALLHLLKKLQSLEASRDRLSIAESIVVATLEMLDARFAILHGVRTTSHGLVTTPLSWAVSATESARIDHDNLDFEEVHLDAQPIFETCSNNPDGYGWIEHDGYFTLAFAVGPVETPVAIIETHCNQRPTEEICHCIHELLAIYTEHLGLLDYAELDTLTRLHNRKTFDENFDRFISLAEKFRLREEEKNGDIPSTGEDRYCWLGVADIDKFKRINDSFGHLFGDEVLIRVADLMKKNFRACDKLFRFGGEEFVVMLRFVSGDSAQSIFERFRSTVETHEFPQVGQVTCSLGYVQIDPSLTPAEILSRADDALYYCKRNGRNQVQRYETLVEQKLIAAPIIAPASNSDLQADIDALFG
jgi:diguanylate cyclase (GGDEF)-like protein